MSLQLKKLVSSTSSQGVADRLRPEEKKSMMEYVVVDRRLAEADDSAHPRASVVAPALSVGEETKAETFSMGRVLAASRGSRVKNNAPIKVTLWQKISQTQATTDLKTASALQPGSSSGFSNFAAMYDLVRCNAIEVHVRAIDGNLSGVASWAAAADPSATGNLSAVIDVLEHRAHTGPHGLSSGASAAPTTGVANSTGYHKIMLKCQPVFVSSTTNDFIGSSWYTTNLTSSIVAYLKPYVENSSGGTVYLTSFVGYHLEFKVRG